MPAAPHRVGVPIVPTLPGRLVLLWPNRGPGAVLDQLEGSARARVGETGLGFVGLASLATLGGEGHPSESVASWLRAAGLGDGQRTTFRAGPGTALVQATRA